MLGDLEGRSPMTPPDPEDLEEAVGDFRSAVSNQDGSEDAAQHLKLAHTYLEMGMSEEAIGSLETASRSSRHRFEAASILARLYRTQQDWARAIEWFERAAEAPAPSAEAGRALLYDLGSALEQTGETARALAVFLELQTDAGDYRDVPARVHRLSRVQAGG
jgi:tetratricopeptide (TPR) repeat protein